MYNTVMHIKINILVYFPYRVTPAPVDGPVLVVHSQQALDLLDIQSDEVQRKDFAEYFGGNRVLPGAEPAAHCYCGHQFGSFSGQLGDGATMYETIYCIIDINYVHTFMAINS